MIFCERAQLVLNSNVSCASSSRSRPNPDSPKDEPKDNIAESLKEAKSKLQMFEKPPALFQEAFARVHVDDHTKRSGGTIPFNPFVKTIPFSAHITNLMPKLTAALTSA